MKSKRQSAVLAVIEEKKIKTHEGIIAELEKRGFYVTQATVSRDIRELALEKNSEGYYTVPEKRKQEHRAKIFSVSVTGIDHAQNLIVIKTTPGAASLVASSVDSVIGDDILGTIAGDDTIFAAARDSQKAEEICGRLAEVFNL